MKTLKPCGTWAAYKRHLGADEPPCDSCRQASRDRDRQRYHGSAAHRLAVNARATRNARLRSSRRAPRPVRDATCPHCATTFESRAATQTYCAPKCRDAAKWDRRRMAPCPSALRTEIVVWANRRDEPGRLVRVDAQPLKGGGRFIDCPQCGGMTGIVNMDAYRAREERWCVLCDIRVIPAR